MVMSSVKKNQERGLGLQGGNRGCSCKYGGQGGLHFNTKTFLDQSFKKKKKAANSISCGNEKKMNVMNSPIQYVTLNSFIFSSGKLFSSESGRYFRDSSN